MGSHHLQAGEVLVRVKAPNFPNPLPHGVRQHPPATPPGWGLLLGHPRSSSHLALVPRSIPALAGHSSRLQQDITHTFPRSPFPSELSSAAPGRED